jgi:hypothetical protein
MKNKIALCFILLLTPHFIFAAKRKKASGEILTCQSAFYSLVQNNIRTVGNIYELSITVNANDVTIDSVWFGATPVPCDLYETKTLQRVSSPVLKGKYLLKANRNLYQNFYRNIDSAFAYNQFRAPFTFKGVLVIMYTHKGKRYYKTVSRVEEHEQKKMRD